MNRDFRLGSAAASTAFLLLSLFAGLVSGADLSSDDKSFLKDAVEEGNAEIALANLALKKSTRPEIKAFAHRITSDHEKANEQLKSIAAANQTEMPSGTGLKYAAVKARLEILAGRDFENDCVNTMVDDQQADIAAFEKEVQYGSDADLKKFASMTLPSLKQYLSMAKTLQGKMVTPQ
jgi:putative membrane protein